MHDLASLLVHQDGEPSILVPGLNERLFREGEIFFEIRCLPGTRVLFDDSPAVVIWTTTERTAGYGRIDLTNQVGFHRFTVVNNESALSFDIQTSTAKATLEEVECMARVVAGQVFAFRKQFVYMTATGQRRAVPLPEVAVGWVRDRMPELVRIVRAIDARPATETRQRFVPSHQARGVSVPRTLRLLRETPGLLEALPGGPLEIEGQTYWPAAVVVREREREPARIEHMQLAHFLSCVATLLVDLRAVVPNEVKALLSKWEAELASLRSTRLITTHDVPNARTAWTPLPTKLQRTEQRYRRARELHAEFLRDIDVAEYNPDAVRANVRDVWEIYQAFAAHMIGRALGLKCISARGDLRERNSDGVAMSSEDYELYYDVRPPASVLRSWRDESLRPADERPDIVIRRRVDGAVAVLDAKFRVDREGRARSEDLFEMQGYLNSFGLKAGGIVFPGSSDKHVLIAGRRADRMLVELPLRARAFEQDAEAALARLRDGLEKIFATPSEHAPSERAA